MQEKGASWAEASPIDGVWKLEFDKAAAGEKGSDRGRKLSGRRLMIVRERPRDESKVDADNNGKKAEGAEMGVEDDRVS